MIQRALAFVTSQGQSFAELKDAQKAELSCLVAHATDAPEMIALLVENADKIVDILTTKPNSKPKARKINGGTKKRKSVADKLLEKVTA